MTRARFSLTLRAKAAMDGDQMMVFGLMSCSVAPDGTRVVDSQNDVITIGELEKGAYGYTANSSGMGLEHSRFQGIGKLIESCVFTAEKIAKMAAVGIEITSAPDCWWVGYKVDDVNVWNRVKSGELSAFSWGGWAKRSPVAAAKAKSLAGVVKSKAGAAAGELFELTDLEIEEGSLVGDPANPLAKVAFFKRAAGAPEKSAMFAKTKAILAKLFTRKMDMGAEAAPPSMQEVLDQREWLEDWWELRDAFDTAVRGIMCSDLPSDQQAAALQESTQQFLDALMALNAGRATDKSASGPDLNALDAALSAVLAQGITATLADDVSKTLDQFESDSGAPPRTQKEKTTMAKTAAEIMKGLSAEDAAVLATEMAKKSLAPSEEILTRLAKAENDSAAAKRDAETAQKAADASAAELLVQKNANLFIQKEAMVKDLIVPAMDHKTLADTLFKSHGTPIHDTLLASWRETTKHMDPLLTAPGSAARTSADSPAQAELAKAMEVHVKAGASDDAARAKAMAENPALAKRVLSEMRNGAN